MTHPFRDVDGTMVVRDRDGTLRPVDEPAEQPTLPRFSPDRMCEEHTIYTARRCPCCWSEVHGGDRPRQFIGRVYVPTPEDAP